MDLYQLRYFLEVARALSFTRAAENAHVSVPAVSKSVALLERSLGRRLFTRNRRRVQMTLDGERLKVHAERVFDALETAELELRGKAAAPAMILIGSREMITNYLLGPSLIAFRKEHPVARFGIYELGPRAMIDALNKDQIDFAFHYTSKISDPALEIKLLGRLTSHVYASRAFLRGGHPRTFAETCRLPFIAPRYFGADPTEPSVDGFPDHKNPRLIQYEGEFLETHRRFVLDGIAAAVLPDFVVRQEWRAGQVIRLPGPPLGREIYFVKRRQRTLPPAVAGFLKIMERSIQKVAF